MTDPKAGIANIKKKVIVPKQMPWEEPRWKTHSCFQPGVPFPVEVSDYNSKPGKLKL